MKINDRVRIKNPANGPFDDQVGKVIKVMGERVRVAFPSGAGRTYHTSKLVSADERRTYPVKAASVEELAAGVPEDLPPPGTPYVDPEDPEKVDTVLDEVEVIEELPGLGEDTPPAEPTKPTETIWDRLKPTPDEPPA